ncbi:MAG TPA: hypothetical protein VM434_03860 [Beijerinckiaceae bacterium]|nr:hypothetical protein [Beijerinckiaceae bacterium]
MTSDPSAGGLVRIARRFSRQPRGVRLLEASAAVAIAIAVFWAAFLGPSRPTGATLLEPAGLDPTQLALTVPTDLPSFDDRHQRYIGVLDTLR